MGTKKANSDKPSWIRFQDEKFYLNSEMTARFFGVTPRTLLDWEKKGCPKVERGWWEPAEILKWLGQGGNVGADTLAVRKLKADTEYREAKAEREKMIKDTLAGKYIPKDKIEEEFTQRVVELKASLLNLPRVIAAEFPDEDIRRSIEKIGNDVVYDALEQYSRAGKYIPKLKSNKNTTIKLVEEGNESEKENKKSVKRDKKAGTGKTKNTTGKSRSKNKKSSDKLVSAGTGSVQTTGAANRKSMGRKASNTGRKVKRKPRKVEK